MKTKFFLTGIVAFVLALTLGTALATQETPLTIEDAQIIALEKVQLNLADVMMTKLSQDRDDGRLVFDVEFVVSDTEYEFEIDAQTGEIIEQSTERVDKSKAAMLSQKLLTMDEAKEKALTQAAATVENAIFLKVELDDEDDQAEYEIEFTADDKMHKVEMNAKSGEIINYTVSVSVGNH